MFDQVNAKEEVINGDELYLQTGYFFIFKMCSRINIHYTPLNIVSNQFDWVIKISWFLAFDNPIER